MRILCISIRISPVARSPFYRGPYTYTAFVFTNYSLDIFGMMHKTNPVVACEA